MPRVTSFEASSKPADLATNRGQLTLSWSTQSADYVEFLYHCVPAPAPNKPGVTISEEGGSRECENSGVRTDSSVSLKSSPNASRKFGFANFEADPKSVTVSITPFSHGVAYPQSGKSITIQVEPYNPFFEGATASNGNVLLTYSPGAKGESSYQQGSTLTESWKDAVLGNSCVNLDLIQGDAVDAKSYRSRLAADCLQPARSGSYKWTVPDKYAGVGYRIFASTPGNASTGLGPSFTITRRPTAP